MQEVLKAFQRFQIDYEQAIAQVTSIWEQMVAAWQQIGSGVGRRSVRGQEIYFRQVLERINEIQRTREARQAVMGALPIPEYQFGGIVRAIYGHTGRILAFLHAGEAVLNRRAVAALGERRIEELNRGRVSGGGEVHLHFHGLLIDGDSVRKAANAMEIELLRRGRRWATDRGLRTPW